MNKSDLVAAIADGSGLTKADAARALSATTVLFQAHQQVEKKFPLQVSVVFWLEVVQLVQDATHKRVQLSKFLPQKCQHLKQVNY